ncbi:TPA: hypothetical protein ACK3Q6_002609 [Burkholderia cepacia]|nr:MULTISPECIES: hypothetical protein [Burkholderia cepacia complex]HDR9763696.1 hypothetical protein [Burkholderia cepacia ATCC 25416]MCA8361282.1 hypothetical protein [Burkholderia cepacia]MCW3498741.1 hypothetical protein [Burkholderia cenocepacia]MCW3506171.1 hypothetical protein [Burkholderia cenocepacia]MCW3513894.1 hypothetical protein [Burkholderia cenocepacia]
MSSLAKERLERIANFEYVSPVIIQLRLLKEQRPNDAITLPNDDVVCIACPASMWNTQRERNMSSDGKSQTIIEPTCFCRPQHKDVWSKEEPDMITMCDEPYLQAEDAAIKLEAMKRGEEQ